MRRALLAAAVLAGSAFPSNFVGAADMTAITTPGKGTLTLCRSWVVYRACKSYYKVALPPRIAVGDRITLTFGSNNKVYLFLVVEVRPKGENCLLLSDQSGGQEDGERLAVEECVPAAEAADARN